MLSAKKMIDTYITYGLDKATWNMFYEMRCHDLVTREAYNKFYETCTDMRYNDDETKIIDGNGKVLYEMDDQGYMIKKRGSQ